MAFRTFGLFVLLFALWIQGVSAKVLERVVGVIGDKVYTLMDLEKAASDFGLRPKEGGNPLQQELERKVFYREVWRRLLEREILDREARRLGVEPKQDEIDRALQRLRRRHGLSEEQLAEELRAQGFTLKGYRRYLKAQMEKSRILDLLIRPKISPSEADLMAYYEAHKDRYAVPKRVRLSQIFIPFAGKGLKGAEEKLEKVLDELERGRPFEEVARAYSEDPSAPEGGDLGYLRADELDPRLWEEIKDLEVGEISPVIRSSKGFHILLLTGKEGTKPLPFEEVKDKVLADYFGEELQRRYEQWLREAKRRYGVKELL